MQKTVEKMTEGAKLDRYKTTTSVIIAFVQTASHLTADSVTAVIEW